VLEVEAERLDMHLDWLSVDVGGECVGW
jgi:hypothetical protein